MNRNKDDIKERIKKFIMEEFLHKGYNLKYDELLFDSGIVDSLGFLKLLVFIEKTFDVSIDMSEISIENFNTIEDIAKIINRKIVK